MLILEILLFFSFLYIFVYYSNRDCIFYFLFGNMIFLIYKEIWFFFIVFLV